MSVPPLPSPQSQQSLLQWCCSRVGLQLPWPRQAGSTQDVTVALPGALVFWLNLATIFRSSHFRGGYGSRLVRLLPHWLYCIWFPAPHPEGKSCPSLLPDNNNWEVSILTKSKAHGISCYSYRKENRQKLDHIVKTGFQCLSYGNAFNPIRL